MSYAVVVEKLKTVPYSIEEVERGEVEDFYLKSLHSIDNSPVRKNIDVYYQILTIPPPFPNRQNPEKLDSRFHCIYPKNRI